jgi:hypothetical protein
LEEEDLFWFSFLRRIDHQYPLYSPYEKPPESVSDPGDLVVFNYNIILPGTQTINAINTPISYRHNPAL